METGSRIDRKYFDMIPVITDGKSPGDRNFIGAHLRDGKGQYPAVRATAHGDQVRPIKSQNAAPYCREPVSATPRKTGKASKEPSRRKIVPGRRRLDATPGNNVAGWPRARH